MVFAGVGFVSLPMDLIRAFVGRPRSTIPRSEYVTRAMALQARAVQMKVRAEQAVAKVVIASKHGHSGDFASMLAKDSARRSSVCKAARVKASLVGLYMPDLQHVHVQEHSGKLKVQQVEGGKSRSWRRNVAWLNTCVSRLEEDMEKLERVFPQAWPHLSKPAHPVCSLFHSVASHSAHRCHDLCAHCGVVSLLSLFTQTAHRVQGEDPDYMWAVMVLGYWARLFAGIVAALLSVTWLLHIALYAHSTRGRSTRKLF